MVAKSEVAWLRSQAIEQGLWMLIAKLVAKDTTYYLPSQAMIYGWCDMGTNTHYKEKKCIYLLLWLSVQLWLTGELSDTCVSQAQSKVWRLVSFKFRLSFLVVSERFWFSSKFCFTWAKGKHLYKFTVQLWQTGEIICNCKHVRLSCVGGSTECPQQFFSHVLTYS